MGAPDRVIELSHKIILNLQTKIGPKHAKKK